MSKSLLLQADAGSSELGERSPGQGGSPGRESSLHVVCRGKQRELTERDVVKQEEKNKQATLSTQTGTPREIEVQRKENWERKGRRR